MQVLISMALFFSILDQLDSNDAFQWVCGHLGHGGTKPIFLSKLDSESLKYVADMCMICVGTRGTRTPLITIVDVLKDLQFKPPKRGNGTYKILFVNFPGIF